MNDPYTTLVSTSELARHISDPGWLAVDVRYDLANPSSGRDQYNSGHIPGAVHADMNRDLASEPGSGRGRHPLPAPEAFEATVRGWGVAPETQIVAYDDSGNAWASRLWWLLKYFGHSAVAVLDGGLPAWVAEGRPLETEAPRARGEGAFRASARSGLVATLDDVARASASHSHVLVDSRAPDRYRGENETIDPVAGHIPGARNRFFKENVEADGRMRAAASLEPELRAALGGRSPADAIVYCGSGVTACANLLALEHAGLAGARLFPGSWSQWCSEPSRPVEIGD